MTVFGTLTTKKNNPPMSWRLCGLFYRSTISPWRK